MRMKTQLTILACLIAGSVQAATIDLGPNRMSYSEGFAFNELNGQTGGHISFDLTFNNNVTVLRSTSNNFEVGLSFLTGNPQFITGTGYLLDANGNPLCGVRPLASATTDNGFMFVGLYPMYMDETGTTATDLSKPFDFYGVHFDLNLPETTILEGSFWISTPDYAGKFRIGPQVPETGATLPLFVLAMLGVVLFNRFVIKTK